ncbi:putative methyltransferase-domain-containing protein [Echria macrotheca]|uniref:Methyltransferase-domain-containing protein n=1 Tax=Echria macrotheca TaxID=438768 RepID=A0AAJ0FA93_9PEZI|nr:putative methyltransferase-domain-containing protein [Echria macrotheca]
MHYIRLLRPPAVERGASRNQLKLALTITTDLGDSYLSPQEPVELSVIGAYHDVDNSLKPVILTRNATPRWRAGMRVLKFDLPLPSQPIQTIQIRPSSRQLTALGTTDVYPAPDSKGLIVGVFADMPSSDEKPSPVCFRSLRIVGGDASAAVNALQVEEDFGDSIARHVWDGGIVTLSFIANMCLNNIPSPTNPMPLFSGLLRQSNHHLDIIELGCGVGIVGIGLSRILRAAGLQADILMTDLPEAEERAQANILRYEEDVRSSEKPEANVEFESLDWQDGRNGVFGERAQASSWDVILVSECTYNTDTLLALVQTLSAIHELSGRSAAPKDTKIFLATKPRHSSEREFFHMMAKERWTVAEQTRAPLPVLDGDDQSVEMYLFSRA